MFIFYGTKGVLAELGDAGLIQCPACQDETPAEAVVGYRYFHIWYVFFCFLTDKKYLFRCRRCAALWQPDDPQPIKNLRADDSIPFLHKNGAVGCLFLISAIMIGLFISNGFQADRVDKYLLSPEPGDVYLADLAFIDGSGFGLENTGVPANSHAYGALLLHRIEGDRRFFFPSKRATDSIGATRKSLDALDYSRKDAFSLAGDAIGKLRENGVILDVKRKTAPDAGTRNPRN